MSALGKHLVLHPFLCRQFGYPDLDEMLDQLRDAPAIFPEAGESEFARALYLNPDRARVRRDELAAYDANLTRHSRRLRMTGEHGRSWKPHQYLALLFTERYLHRYFDDPEKLLRELNRERAPERRRLGIPDYTPDDLRTLAFQSATGSGKTLLMHAHILQYRHYLDRAGSRLNNIVLLTPNEQLSAQHERELRASGLHARLFSSESATDLFRPVEILDLNKLAKKKGVKRVAVAEFGDDNLVLVDEGHLGASGRVWREHRRELSSGGFAFEYSATFDQVVRGRDRALLHAYGKCLLFDYSYRRFHADGYGKDYLVSNLPDGAEDENSDLYLLGCLLTFYQQCRIWRERTAEWKAFNLEKPLLAFLGKTVTGSSKPDQATRSDVVRILAFLGWVLARGDAVRPLLARLLDGRSGLLAEGGGDWFAGRFEHLPRDGTDLYADLCELLFHGQGRLRIIYLTAGDGELHLRVGDRAPFGVVNVGNSASLHQRLLENANPNFTVERELGFARALFDGVDRSDSPVNFVVGARRFIAGWNSWRVSTMGLMHVGVGEGPEIIQMFGRGVRLKGEGMSLKRHSGSGADALANLETLHIFGLRANYMRTFRDLLRAEGIGVERTTITLPVTWNFAQRKDLKLLRIKGGVDFQNSDRRPVLPAPGAGKELPPVESDLRSRLETVASADLAGTSGAEPESVRIPSWRLALFDRVRIRDTLTRHKERSGWHNLVIPPETVARLLENDSWYRIHGLPEQLEVQTVEEARALEAVVCDLLAKYAARFWQRERRQWEHEQLEVVTLDEDESEPDRGTPSVRGRGGGGAGRVPAHRYYPDFLVWLVGERDQHVLFLDPKGLVRYGRKEREKVKLHTGIKEVELRLRRVEPDLHLHAYVLSVTAPEEIGDEPAGRKEWNRRGVYFLDDADWLPRLIGDALDSVAS